jgi:hypothetical protein
MSSEEKKGGAHQKPEISPLHLKLPKVADFKFSPSSPLLASKYLFPGFTQTMLLEMGRVPEKQFSNESKQDSLNLNVADVWLVVMSFLNIKSLCRFMHTCKRVRHIANDPAIRTQLYEAHQRWMVDKFSKTTFFGNPPVLLHSPFQMANPAIIPERELHIQINQPDSTYQDYEGNPEGEGKGFVLMN